MQHFSTRFNKVYHAIHAKIKLPPIWDLLHYTDAFDPEMAFRLRERDPAALEEMKNVAIDVESNLLNREAKLKAMKKEKIEKEQLISSGIKLDMLTNIVNKMMHMISRKYLMFH